jgi:pimeloyl-ACP methyl ester carboxylesterase
LAFAYADDHDKTFQQIVEDYQFPLNEYNVTTSDGYILKTFRIPHGRDQEYDDSRPAVLIQHGYFDSADFVVMNGPEKSLAFYLANQGFDVWIGNGRGNKFSRAHEWLNPDKDAEFWDYSFVERKADDRANIELIREITGQDKISVIAHSEATASFWTALSEDSQWYNDRVNLLIALGPVSKLDNIETLLLKSLGANGAAIGLVKLVGIHEFFYPNFWTNIWFSTTCGAFPQICRFSTYLISDGDTSLDDLDSLRNYYGHYPAGISVKSLEHTLQVYRNKRFAYFDYGSAKNMEKYGTKTPPEIDLSKIENAPPIAMMVGTSDLLGDLKDNEWLKNQLGANVKYFNTYEAGHITFFIGKDVSYMNDVVDVLDQYNNHVSTYPKFQFNKSM